jgi:hypothetical protein
VCPKRAANLRQRRSIMKLDQLDILPIYQPASDSRQTHETVAIPLSGYAQVYPVRRSLTATTVLSKCFEICASERLSLSFSTQVTPIRPHFPSVPRTSHYLEITTIQDLHQSRSIASQFYSTHTSPRNGVSKSIRDSMSLSNAPSITSIIYMTDSSSVTSHKQGLGLFTH